MWVKIATRKDLLEIMQADPPWDLRNLRESESPEPWPAAPGDILLLWPDSPHERPTLPATAVIARADQRDFLAWAMTYLPHARPFTAFCRVADSEIAGKIFRRKGKPWLGTFQNACLGTILGEAATYLDRQSGRMSIVACRSTFSFSMARAMACGLLAFEGDQIGKAWFDLRSLTNQPRLSLGTEVLEGVWSVVRGLSGEGERPSRGRGPSIPARVAEACVDLQNSGRIHAQRWHGIVDGITDVNNAHEVMSGPIEDRVVALEKALTALVNNRSIDRTTAAFVSGYLASQVGPGMLEHMGLLAPFLQYLPGALVWYGLCAGLHKQANLLNFSDGLGRRIAQELLRNDSLLDKPNFDIALPELEILIGTDNRAFELRTASYGQLEVEISPCVKTVVRWPHRIEKEQDLFPSRDQLQDAKTICAQLTETLDRAASTSRRLGRIFGASEGSREREERKYRK
jgi:hypothetical protein